MHSGQHLHARIQNVLSEGVQFRFLASLKPLSVEPLGAPVIKYTHTNYETSRPGTGYYPGKAKKSSFLVEPSGVFDIKYTHNQPINPPRPVLIRQEKF